MIPRTTQLVRWLKANPDKSLTFQQIADQFGYKNAHSAREMVRLLRKQGKLQQAMMVFYRVNPDKQPSNHV